MSDQVPLREYFQALRDADDRRYEELRGAQEKAVQAALAAQEKAVTAALAASEKAVAVAERNAEQWRAGANEWRGSMTDRERNFASKGDLDGLKERVDRTEGGGKGMEKMWGWVAFAIVVAISLFNAFGPHAK